MPNLLYNCLNAYREWLLILTKLNIHHLRMLPHNLFWPNGFCEEDDYPLLYSYVIIWPLLWPPPISRDHDLNKHKSTLHEEGFQISFHFSGPMVFVRKIFKDFLFFIFQTWLYPTLGCFHINFNFSSRMVFPLQVPSLKFDIPRPSTVTPPSP